MNQPQTDFSARLDATAADIDRLLKELLADKPVDGEIARPARLLEAMRYASLSGGKKLRPFLVAETAALFDVPRELFALITRGNLIDVTHDNQRLLMIMPVQESSQREIGVFVNWASALQR